MVNNCLDPVKCSMHLLSERYHIPVAMYERSDPHGPLLLLLPLIFGSPFGHRCSLGLSFKQPGVLQHHAEHGTQITPFQLKDIMPVKVIVPCLHRRIASASLPAWSSQRYWSYYGTN